MRHHLPSRGFLCCLALLVASTTLTLGTSIDDVRLSADCVGYTLTIEASGFEEGDLVTLDYRFVLEYLGPDPDGRDVTVIDSYDVSCEPGELTCSPRVTLYETWSEVLGAPLPCGDYRLITTDAGSCDDIRTRWEWRDLYGYRQCNHLHPADGWDGFLFCPCDGDVQICRSTGFWGTHAGEEKRRSENVTLAVLEAGAANTMVCGQPIYETLVGSDASAVEAICVSPRGDQRLQLARQLTAAALNCIMTSGDPSCADVSIGADFESCNDACAAGLDEEYSICIDVIDCFNNGGVLLDGGFCQIGTCAGDGVTPCDDDDACGLDDAGYPIACVPFDDSCHEQPLVNEELGLDFDPPGPAGSPKACRQARKNHCTIFDCGGGDSRDDGKRGRGRGGR